MSPSTAKPGYDAELYEALETFPQIPALDQETLKAQRELTSPTPEMILTDRAISHEESSIPGPGGETQLSILRSRSSAGGGGARPAILYMHSGGMILGSKLFGIQLTFEWVKQLDAVVISVEYRLAPEHPAPAALEDCYSSLCWVAKNASTLGVDPEKIMVAGGSAGGGLATGVALMARDRNGPKIVGQCLLYPMLDDRMDNVSSSQFYNEGTWTGKSNLVAWNWYLSGQRGKRDVSIYAAPGRASAEALKGLPPTWIDVGSAELFRDEDVAYAGKLWEAGVQVELHVWPGAWHAFDLFTPEANVTKTCLETRLQWVKRLLTAKPAPIQKIPAVL